MDSKTSLLLAGEDKHPIGSFTRTKELWEYLLENRGLTGDSFQERYVLSLDEQEKPCTYSNICKVMRSRDKLVIYTKDTDTSVFRVWRLPVNPVWTQPAQGRTFAIIT